VQEVLCDLVLVDAILRRNAGATVTLHVKDAPVFVSDVTEKDVGWLVGGGPWGKPRGNHGFLGRNLESIAVAKYTGGK
jgi:hypothetical protein